MHPGRGRLVGRGDAPVIHPAEHGSRGILCEEKGAPDGRRKGRINSPTGGAWECGALPVRRLFAAPGPESERQAFGRSFGSFSASPEQLLAPIHLRPDLLRPDAGLGPEHDEMIEQVGALADHRLAVAVHRVDHDLDRLLRQLLGDLRSAGAHQPRGARLRRIALLQRDHRSIEALERITHRRHYPQTNSAIVNDWGRGRKKARRR